MQTNITSLILIPAGTHTTATPIHTTTLVDYLLKRHVQVWRPSVLKKVLIAKVIRFSGSNT